MSKVYGYGRSAQRNEEEKTRKLKIIYDYCQANNLEVEKYFFDSGVSGLELNRKDLNALIDVLRGGDIIVTDSVSSLSRSMFESRTLISLINNIGAELVIANNTK